MRLRLDRTRVLQIGLLGLLAICVAQIVWWTVDEAHHTSAVIEEAWKAEKRDAEVANELVASGMSAVSVAVLFPGLGRDAEGRFAPSPQALRDLETVRRHRLKRYRWEGGFFLAVLLVGMSVLAHALHEDAQLRRRQQNFLAAVSHEFKTPIAGMRLSAETIALRDPPAERRTELVGRLLSELGRLERLVYNLLDTGLIDERRMRHHPERVELEPIVRNVLRDFEARLHGRDVTLANEVPPELEIHADPVAVQAVVNNLVDNAVKATAHREGGAIRVTAAREGSQVRMEVIDNGVGFDPREADRIFHKFYRTGDEMRRKNQGAGLGLYLVRRFAERNGGEVSARSEGDGRGACVRVTWPVPIAEAEGSA
jgi:two-component system sensor histidine kinase SenX3